MSWRDLLVGLCLRLGPSARLIPAGLRSGVVRHLDAALLHQAIGNIESRDELFWLRREAWSLAQHIVGLDATDDRFRQSDWRLGLEAEIARVAFMPLVAHHYRARRAGIRDEIDGLLKTRWAACVDRAIWKRREIVEASSAARTLDAPWRAGMTKRDDTPGVMDDLALTLRKAAGRGAVGVFFGQPGFFPSGDFAPVLRALGDAGVFVIWVECDDNIPPRGRDSGGLSREYEWGMGLRLSLPAPEELAGASVRHRIQYLEVSRRLLDGCRRLPAGWRWARHAVEPLIPVLAHRWVAASALADVLFDEVSVRFVHVQADKSVSARAFIMAARRHRIRSSYYYSALELGAPTYWPIADRILVTNPARADRLRELGVPPERTVVVGSLEVDRVTGTARTGGGGATSDSRLTVLVLTKWPAPQFFGDLDRLGAVLSEMVRVAPRWRWIIKPHPKDTTPYERLSADHPAHVEVYRDGYAELIAAAALVVTGMGNALFHAMAVGKPLVVFNPDPRVNLGHDRLFARSDLPPRVLLTRSWEELGAALQRFASGAVSLDPYDLPPSLTSHLYHSLDGTTARRIAASLVEGAAAGLA